MKKIFWRKFEIDFRDFYLLPSIRYDWYDSRVDFDWLGIHYWIGW